MGGGKEAVPFLLSKEESREPLATLGRDRVLCRVGGESNWMVTVGAIADGRVQSRLKAVPAEAALRSLAGSPDGKTVYYVAPERFRPSPPKQVARSSPLYMCPFAVPRRAPLQTGRLTGRLNVLVKR